MNKICYDLFIGLIQ